MSLEKVQRSLHLCFSTTVLLKMGGQQAASIKVLYSYLISPELNWMVVFWEKTPKSEPSQNLHVALLKLDMKLVPEVSSINKSSHWNAADSIPPTQTLSKARSWMFRIGLPQLVMTESKAMKVASVMDNVITQ